MEQQPTCLDDNDHKNKEPGTQVPFTTTLPTSSITSSGQSLRFPKPEGSQQLANWVSSSSHDITQHPTMSEDGGSLMGESTYELIHSPEQDSPDVMSESVSSLECPRSEDVHSLNGSSHDENTDSESDDGSGQEDQRSSASSIRYTNQVLQSPSTHANPTNLHFRRSPEASMLPQSIEFLEIEEQTEGQVDVDEISVKHTVREFDEEETASIASTFNLQDAPKRLAATIRQTMSSSCLSTQEPVRIMYTGSPQGLKDVVYKLSSAFWASGTTNGDASVTLRNTDAVYSIVPVSFRSSEAPEIELMESSGLQIKVEHCIAAQETQLDDGCSPEDSVYHIKLDPNNKTYKSYVTPNGAVVEPKWALPHIAIFFLTDSDGKEAQQTQDAAWEVMSRHSVPCIFICNNQSFDKPPTSRWSRFIDQHAVHMCIESRDPERPMLPHRLPVDLESFLNIDARQMNRNLTYLTGLSEPAAACEDEKDLSNLESSTHNAGKGSDTAKPHSSTQLAWAGVRDYLRNNQEWLAPLAMTILMGLLAMLASVLMGPGQVTPSQLSLQSTSAISAILPKVPTASVTKSSTGSITTSTMVSTTTSTTTVNLKRADAASSPLASALSFAGFLSDKASTAIAKSEAKLTTICTVERVSDRDIMVQMPPKKKTAWGHGATLSFEVRRGETALKLSNISDVAEGFNLQLDKRDAYGTVNVSVLSAKKPRINETFEINFGKGKVLVAFEAGVDVLQDLAANVAGTATKPAAQVADFMVELGQTIRDDAAGIAGHIEGAGHTAQRAADRVKDSLTQSQARLISALEQAKSNAADRVAKKKEDVEFGVLTAQIASKLWWLKVRGQKEEYANYEQKASKFLKDRHAAINKIRTQRALDGGVGTGRLCTRKRLCKGQPCHQLDCPQQTDTSIGSKWRKMLVG